MQSDLSASLGTPARIAAIARYELPDAFRDGLFERVTRIAAAVFEVPIATITVVHPERVRFVAAVGLDGLAEIGTEPGLSASAVLHDGPYVVTDAAVDPRTVDHPLVRDGFGVRFYAAVPIVTPQGHRIGTVDVIDRTPRSVTDRETGILVELAGLVAEHLELQAVGARAVRDERRLRQIADQRADRSDVLAEQLQAAAEVIRRQVHPATCELGGRQGCPRPAELKLADSWGDCAWACPDHAEEAILTVSSVFIADESLGGLTAFRRR